MDGRFDFVTMPDRHGKDSIAADMNENDFWPLPQGKTRPGFDKIPMWIADMNFHTAPSVMAALKRRMEHPIFGYYVPSDEYYAAIIRWQKDMFGVEGLKCEHIGYENGVLGGITSALRILSSDGEPILLHSPTYTGFTTQLTRNGFRIVLSGLVQDSDGIWRMDYEDMERKIRENRVHTALFCSPQNPSGRVWELWELEKMMELFRRLDVYVISDEIWSDLALFGYRHIPLQSVSADAKMRTIAFYSPSKTFNLAGLVGSYHVVYNPYLRDRLVRQSELSHYNDMNVLSMHSLIGAYTPDGKAWMTELKQVLEENVTYTCDYVMRHFRGVKFYRPQGTFVLLLDCEKWCRARDVSLEDVLVRGVEVGVIWRDGRAFHVPYGIRLSLALPNKKLREALDRLDRYVFNTADTIEGKEGYE